jgi:hypothetical protein
MTTDANYKAGVVHQQEKCVQQIVYPRDKQPFKAEAFTAPDGWQFVKCNKCGEFSDKIYVKGTNVICECCARPDLEDFGFTFIDKPRQCNGSEQSETVPESPKDCIPETCTQCDCIIQGVGFSDCDNGVFCSRECQSEFSKICDGGNNHFVKLESAKDKLTLLKEQALMAYESIFNDRNVVPVQVSKSGLRFVKFGSLLLIEQNKDKPSLYGKLAKTGQRILWAIQGDRYVARIHEGTFTLL